MGEVYLAEDTALRRRVALKRVAPHLRTDTRYRKRLREEAQRASALNSPGIAAVYDLLEDERGETLLVMELVEGESLRQRLLRPVPLRDFLAMARQCCEALTAAHTGGILHRDLKPENIMLTTAGRIKILDFGLAKQVNDDAGIFTTESIDARLSGTVGYIAPEVLLGGLGDERSDLFALGVIFYEALTGKHPFRGAGAVATFERVLHESPPPISQVAPGTPEALERIVGRMLARDPERRYPSVQAVLDDLTAYEESGSSPALPRIPVRERAVRWARPVALSLIAAAIVMAALMRLFPGWGALPQTKSLVVLPFRCISQQSQAYCDGLTQTLTARLAHFQSGGSLQVAPASEVHLRQVKSADEARRLMGANLVVEGSLHQAGDQVRATFALVDAGSMRQVRAGTLTAAMADSFAVEDQIVESVVSSLELALVRPATDAAVLAASRVAGAYAPFLEGKGLLLSFDKLENINAAIDAFNRSISLDPAFAAAHAAMGEAYRLKYERTAVKEDLESARDSCERAAQLGPQLAAAHTCLGSVYSLSGGHERAVQEFTAALRQEPNDDAALVGLAEAYAALTRFSEAEAAYKRAISMRPGLWIPYNRLGAFYFRQARYPEAETMFRKVIELAPDNARGYSNLGGLLVHVGRAQEAIPILQRSTHLERSAWALTNLGTAYYQQRQYREAAAMYRQSVSMEGNQPELWGNLGAALAALPDSTKDAETAFREGLRLADEQIALDPRNAWLLSLSAKFQAHLGNRQDALRRIKSALALEPGNAEVRFHAAVVHLLADDVGGSMAELGRAAELGYPVSTIRRDHVFQGVLERPELQAILRRAEST